VSHPKNIDGGCQGERYCGGCLDLW